MAYRIILNIFVLDIGGIKFVDGIICQMHVHVFFVIFVWAFISMSSQPSKPLFEPENFEWDKAFDQNIDSEVIFAAIDEVRVGDILLDNRVLLWHHVDILGEEDSFSLGTG